jgi:hypothetical protein
VSGVYKRTGNRCVGLGPVAQSYTPVSIDNSLGTGSSGLGARSWSILPHRRLRQRKTGFGYSNPCGCVHSKTVDKGSRCTGRRIDKPTLATNYTSRPSTVVYCEKGFLSEQTRLELQQGTWNTNSDTSQSTARILSRCVADTSQMIRLSTDNGAKHLYRRLEFVVESVILHSGHS